MGNWWDIKATTTMYQVTTFTTYWYLYTKESVSENKSINRSRNNTTFNYIVYKHSCRGCSFYSLPQLTLPRRVQGNDTSPLGLEQDRCTGEGQITNIVFRDQCLISFNADQRVAYNAIAACLEDGYVGSKIFNINAPGGCGKTFLLNDILAHARGLGYKCIAAASSGIAATLLNGGRTAHSFFGIPIPILNTSTCNVKLNTKLGN